MVSSCMAFPPTLFQFLSRNQRALPSSFQQKILPYNLTEDFNLFYKPKYFLQFVMAYPVCTILRYIQYLPVQKIKSLHGRTPLVIRVRLRLEFQVKKGNFLRFLNITKSDLTHLCVLILTVSIAMSEKRVKNFGQKQKFKC